MKASILLILKKLTYAWYNIKSSPSINQKRYELKGSREIPEDEVQNCCKRSCID